MKLTQKVVSQTHRILVYGPPKVGKSLLVGKLAEHFNLTWFDLENGYTTLLQLPKAWQEKIDVISIPDTRTFPVAVETCLKVIKGGPQKICEEHGKISCPACTLKKAAMVSVELSKFGAGDCVVFDSLTQLTNSAIAYITRGKSDEYKLDYDDWGTLGKLMEIFLSHVQQAGYNVVCISHETEAELEDGKKKLVPVAGTRNASRNVAKYFDHVVYCQISNKQHGFISSTTGALNVNTGSRTGVAIETKGSSAQLIDLWTPAVVPTVTAAAVATSKLQELLSKK